MDITEIEKALNELIADAFAKSGCVWIVDKHHNNFAFRLSAPVKIRAFIPNNNESEE